MGHPLLATLASLGGKTGFSLGVISTGGTFLPVCEISGVMRVVESSKGN